MLYMSLIICLSVLVTYRVWCTSSSAQLAGWLAGSLFSFTVLDWALMKINHPGGPIELSVFFLLLVRLALYTLPCLLARLTRRARPLLTAPAASNRSKVAVHGGAAPTRLVPITILVEAGLLLLGVYALFIEPDRLGVTRLELPAPNIFPGRPLRILHLTDLHIISFGAYEQKVLDLVNAQQPDLIVLTGDYTHLDRGHEPPAIQAAQQFMRALHAPYGVYAINGNGDQNSIAPTAMLVEGSDVVFLNNEVYRLPLESGELYLVGLSNHNHQMAGSIDQAMLAQLMAQVPSEAYSILLYHTPFLYNEAAQAHVDLYLAGHTHGGQIRIPFYGALIKALPQYPDPYDMGLHTFGDTRLYVSRGIGVEGLSLPRMRFLCPPELVLITLTISPE